MMAAVHPQSILSSVALAILAVILVKFVILLLTKWRFHRQLSRFPKHPRGSLFIGDAKALRDGARGMKIDFDNIYDNNEKVMQFWITPFQPGVVCYHPDSLKAIYSTKDPKEPNVYNYIKPWIGEGLLTSEGSKWARNRRLLTPGFHFDILKPYVPAFAEGGTLLVDKWKAICDKGPCSIDVADNANVSLATLHSLMKCIMGVEDNAYEGKESYLKAIYSLTEQGVKRLLTLPYVFDTIYSISSDGFVNRRAIKVAHDFSRKVIRERRATANDGDIIKPKKKLLPFIDILLKAKDEDGTGLTDQEIRDEVDTFMFEGHDTTASGMTWILYNLAQNPDFQERCRDEVDEVMDWDHDRESTLQWDDLTKLEFLTKFIKESLRLHPPVPVTVRRLVSPLTLPDGRVVPKGCTVYCHINGVHRNPNVWKDPLTFDPERFSMDSKEHRPPHAYVPFAAGSRNCIGQHFALSELKVMTAVLLHNLRFAPDPSKPPTRINKTVLRSDNGVHLMVQKR